MKKLTILALIMLLPAAVTADTVTKEGDPGFFFGFPGGTIDIYPGQTIALTPAPTNFGFVSGSCTAGDTFCVHMADTAGWTLGPDPDCFTLGSGSYIPGYEVTVTCPCEVNLGDLNLVTATMAFCDVSGVCQPDSGDCEDPNFYGGNPYYYQATQVFQVVEAPPALFVLQDTLFFVEEGVTTAYIPFGVCNGDPCAPPTDYDYIITSVGWVGGAINQPGTATAVLGGTCKDVFGLVDASLATVCDYDTLTIVVWDVATGTAYDTCVQAIHIVEPVPVPLFTAPVVTILVLAMILAAAVIMKRHAVSKA
jgi:hypothetical protein